MTYEQLEVEAQAGNPIAKRMLKITQAVKSRATEPEPDSDRAWKKEALWRKACVPKRHEKRTEFSGGTWLSKRDELVGRLGSGFIIALIGTRGTGKTQLGVELIRAQIDRVGSAHFCSAMDIFLAIKSSYRRDAETDERVIVGRFCKPALLVVDEVQERAETAWEDRILTHIINSRYNDEKDTVLIANLTAEAFSQCVGTSILSRLNETGGLIQCNWESFR